ncbi:hypothetical protein KFU94_61250 [Chloroflexi bacterium TSY]|nr:hypothetical protein [Chloroflexi bacterium TSY]
MHCNLKSSQNYLYRSERTNWRELGDFTQYPTLESYVRVVIPEKYGTEDLDEAAQIFLREHIYPFVQQYDPEKFYPYPKLVIEQIERNPIYQIVEENGTIVRHFIQTII